jgi:hypothetical protein
MECSGRRRSEGPNEQFQSGDRRDDCGIASGPDQLVDQMNGNGVRFFGTVQIGNENRGIDEDAFARGDALLKGTLIQTQSSRS